MRIVVTTPPEPLVDIEDVKVALGEDSDDRNDLIQTLINAGQSYLDGPKGITGFAVARQSVDVYFDNFDADIFLPGGSILDPISSVQYLDSAQSLQVLESSYYALQSNGRLALAGGKAWPSVSSVGDGVVVSYDLGITDSSDPRIDQMRAAIIMHVKMTLDMTDPEIYDRVITSLVAPLRMATL